jgi:hypothetical protein
MSVKLAKVNVRLNTLILLQNNKPLKCHGGPLGLIVIETRDTNPVLKKTFYSLVNQVQIDITSEIPGLLLTTLGEYNTLTIHPIECSSITDFFFSFLRWGETESTWYVGH